MVETIHEIDPNADTLLMLNNPNINFAPWSPERIGTNATASAEVSSGGDIDTDIFDPADSYVTSSSVTHLVDGCSFEEEIHFRVSSRHLALASPIFKNMLLGGNWNEGIRNETDGLYHVTAEDLDTEALLVVLEILHHRNRRVPRTISLEMLAKLSVIIDYYKCAEALELFTERWVEHLKATSPVPSHFCRDLFLWICIAWVLKLPREFAQATTVAIRQDCKDLPSLGLPIMGCIDRIKKDQMQAIVTVFSQLEALVDEYRSQSYICPTGASFECGSMLFGALTKEMELQGLSPVPTAPFTGWRISELYTKMQRIRSPTWSISKKSRHYCNLSARVMAIADPVIRLANGPRLEDFDTT